mmetsp:Transcript_36211/g.61755  ORF Transcript_36211/g.61755 Transcript_36211/m.61755 type:complete len:113 (+) Transcript_36211:557-895(+)
MLPSIVDYSSIISRVMHFTCPAFSLRCLTAILLTVSGQQAILKLIHSSTVAMSHYECQVQSLTVGDLTVVREPSGKSSSFTVSRGLKPPFSGYSMLSVTILLEICVMDVSAP